MRRAFITGITGQDGSYLAELLLDQGYEVHGLIRRGGNDPERSHIRHLWENSSIRGRRLFLHQAELTDREALRGILRRLGPAEVYHLAGQSHVGMSFEIPESTCELTGMATLRLLEAVREGDPPARFFHASSSEVFGRPEQSPQDEATPMRPVSPYGCAKAFASHLVRVYRESFGLFAVNGILYNHESPRRGEGFVTRRICRAAAAIRAGHESELVLGDTDAERDWGHARDYVRGMWMMLQREEPEDYILASGELHTVQEVVEIAFATVGLDWRRHVRHDPARRRPAEPARLTGRTTRAQERLGWRPTVSFDALIREMVRAEQAAFS